MNWVIRATVFTRQLKDFKTVATISFFSSFYLIFSFHANIFATILFPIFLVLTSSSNLLQRSKLINLTVENNYTNLKPMDTHHSRVGLILYASRVQPNMAVKSVKLLIRLGCAVRNILVIILIIIPTALKILTTSK